MKKNIKSKEDWRFRILCLFLLMITPTFFGACGDSGNEVQAQSITSECKNHESTSEESYSLEAEEGESEEGESENTASLDVYVDPITSKRYEEKIEWEVKGTTLIIKHLDFATWCLPPNSFKALIESNDDELIVREMLKDEEAAGKCTCVIDTEHEITDLEPGNYTVKFYFNKIRYQDTWEGLKAFEITL